MLEKPIRNNYSPDAPAWVVCGNQQTEWGLGQRVSVMEPEPAGISEMMWTTRCVVFKGLGLKRRCSFCRGLWGQNFPLT